LKGIIHPDDA